MSAIKTVLLVRHKYGWREVVDSAAVSTWGRREGTLSLGTATTAEEVDRVGGEQLALVSSPLRQIQVAYEDTDGSATPIIDFGFFDTLDVSPGLDAGTDTVPPVAVTFSKDASGIALIAPEFGDIVESQPRKVARAMSKVISTLDGRSSAASPIRAAGTGSTPVQTSGSGPHGPYFIAASDATDEEKARADQVCTGTADDAIIQAALYVYAIVILSSGTFNIENALALSFYGGQLIGSGRESTIIVGTAEYIAALVELDYEQYVAHMTLSVRSADADGSQAINMTGSYGSRAEYLLITGGHGDTPLVYIDSGCSISHIDVDPNNANTWSTPIVHLGSGSFTDDLVVHPFNIDDDVPKVQADNRCRINGVDINGESGTLDFALGTTSSADAGNNLVTNVRCQLEATIFNSYNVVTNLITGSGAATDLGGNNIITGEGQWQNV